MGPIATTLIVVGSIAAYIFCGVVVSAVTVTIYDWEMHDEIAVISGIFWPLWIIGCPLGWVCYQLHKIITQLVTG